MDRNRLIKNTALLAAPLLLFAILLIPYSWLNQTVIVDLFGCGCPKFTETGECITPDFNANHFTALFWSVISLCATVIAGFLSKRIHKVWLRAVYILAIFGISLLISREFSQMMMVN